MTSFLASVRSRAEAEHVLAAGADIVDLKEPDNGALGAVAPDMIRQCLTAIRGRRPVSATVGDLPMTPGVVADAVTATAGLRAGPGFGVDIVKLGVMPGGDARGCLEALRALDLSADLVLVFFADALPDLDPIEAAIVSGARGVMLDTAGKGRGSLTDHMALGGLGRFVARAHAAGLQAGLAGSLTTRHVTPLLSLQPDVIGFRGALCERGERGLKLDRKACAKIAALIAAGRECVAARFEARATSAMC